MAAVGTEIQQKYYDREHLKIQHIGRRSHCGWTIVVKFMMKGRHEPEEGCLGFNNCGQRPNPKWSLDIIVVQAGF
jgi:hypothetical protein